MLIRGEDLDGGIDEIEESEKSLKDDDEDERQDDSTNDDDDCGDFRRRETVNMTSARLDVDEKRFDDDHNIQRCDVRLLTNRGDVDRRTIQDRASGLHLAVRLE